MELKRLSSQKSMKYLPLLLLLLFGCSNRTIKPLFVTTDRHLNEKQQKVFDSIKAERWIIDPTVVSLQKLEGQSFLLPLPEETIEIKGYKRYSDGSVTWRNNNDTEFGLLTIRDGKCNGMFYSGKKIYAIQHLDEDLHVLSQIDKNNVPRSSPKKAK